MNYAEVGTPHVSTTATEPTDRRRVSRRSWPSRSARVGGWTRSSRRRTTKGQLTRGSVVHYAPPSVEISLLPFFPSAPCHSPGMSKGPGQDGWWKRRSSRLCAAAVISRRRSARERRDRQGRSACSSCMRVAGAGVVGRESPNRRLGPAGPRRWSDLAVRRRRRLHPGQAQGADGRLAGCRIRCSISFKATDSYIASDELKHAVNVAVALRSSPPGPRRARHREDAPGRETSREPLGLPLIPLAREVDDEGEGRPLRLRHGPSGSHDFPIRRRRRRQRPGHRPLHPASGRSARRSQPTAASCSLIDEIDKADIEFPETTCSPRARRDAVFASTRPVARSPRRSGLSS